jgi:hypothetical protein
MEPQIMNVKRDFESLEVWFVAGSQHLYGEQALAQVADNSRHVVDGPGQSAQGRRRALAGSGSPGTPGGVDASDLYTPTPDTKGKVLVQVNGKQQNITANDGYVPLTRTWKPGDRIVVELPMDVQRIHCDDRVTRPELDKRTIDKVVIGRRKSEKQHKMEGKNTQSGEFHQRWRHAGDGWFSYELTVAPDGENNVLCTYWGSDVGNRVFDIVVDGETIATQRLMNSKPNEFFDVEYPIPDRLIRGKNAVRVKLQAKPGATAGGVFDLRIVRGPTAQPRGTSGTD